MSSERIAVTLIFFSWAGDLFFDFEDKKFRKIGNEFTGEIV
jgi:hypothetical protein